MQVANDTGEDHKTGLLIMNRTLHTPRRRTGSRTMLAIGLLSASLLAGCGNPYNPGARAGSGALIGAGGGAAIGAIAGGGGGAAIGALAGGATGAAVGAATTPTPRSRTRNGY